MTSFLREANDCIRSASVVFMQENIQLHDDLKVRLFWSADMVSCFFELPSPYTKKICPSGVIFLLGRLIVLDAMWLD